MKAVWTLWLCMLSVHNGFTQVLPDIAEQQLENQTAGDEAAAEDDSYLQELEKFKKHPVNLNSAETDDLESLHLLTQVQIGNLLTYRQLLGHLVSIYELQAVPYWDISTIKKILPFCTVAIPGSVRDETALRFRQGEHMLLLRTSQLLERAEGFKKSAAGTTSYAGSQQRILFRYRYNYKNLLQFGITGDKDAGENFLRGAQKAGFDFYSIHFFMRKLGRVQALAIGDFTVNMGQGLIQWQGMAFKKSAAVISISRQSPVLKPYNAAGEFYFHRGAGITWQQGKMEFSTFISYRRLNANRDPDSTSSTEYISSLLTSGNNRTISELEDRSILGQLAAGGSLLYRNKGLQCGLNGIHYTYSLPMRKREEPYNLYAISGRNWFNGSVSYSYIHKNIYFFGEAAADKTGATAVINGMQLSLDPRADLSVLYRSVSQRYQALNANAFTENSKPGNEQGWYMGLSIRPAPGWKLDVYADIYKFPWLRYQADAPAGGKDFLVQVSYIPGKQAEMYTRYRYGLLPVNYTGNTTPVNYLVNIPVRSWRTQLNFKISPSFSIRTRAEMLWYNYKAATREAGYLAFIDFLYKPMLSPVSAVARVQYFETSGYNSRVYAYENDVLYSYSVPGNAGRGYRYYFLLNGDVGRRASVWLRLAQTVFPGIHSIGTGADEIKGNHKTELKLQIRYLF